MSVRVCVCVCVLAKFAFCPLPWRKLLSKVVSLSPLTHKFDCRTYPAISFRFLSPHFSLCSRISCYCFLCVFAIVFSCIVRSLPFSFFLPFICSIFRPQHFYFWLILLFSRLWCKKADCIVFTSYWLWVKPELFGNANYRLKACDFALLSTSLSIV